MYQLCAAGVDVVALDAKPDVPARAMFDQTVSSGRMDPETDAVETHGGGYAMPVKRRFAVAPETRTALVSGRLPIPYSITY